MKKHQQNVKFFCESRSHDGKTHWAINTYNTSSGKVTQMNDFKFPDLCYDRNKLQEAIVTEDNSDARFYVEVLKKKKYAVVDRINDKVIAYFYDLTDANHFCESKNGDELFREYIQDSELNS